MKTTWGIYGEIVAGRLDLYRKGEYRHALSEPSELLLHLTKDLEPFLGMNLAWSIHLVAWIGPTAVPERLVAEYRGDTHVEIKLREKGPTPPKSTPEMLRNEPFDDVMSSAQARFRAGLQKAATGAGVTTALFGAPAWLPEPPTKSTPDAEQFALLRECNQKLREISELIPRDYLDVVQPGVDAVVVRRIHELLYGPRAAVENKARKLDKIMELIPVDYVQGLGAKEISIFHQIRALLYPAPAVHREGCGDVDGLCWCGPARHLD